MSLDMLKQGIMALVFIAIIAAAGAIALDDFNADLTANSYADNITTSGLEGVDNASDYFDTIGTLLGVSALVGVVVFGFYRAMR